MATVSERLWLWGHEAGSHDRGWDIPSASRMTPSEAAFYMGIPNLIMVRYDGRPAPPFDQYALSLSPLREVVWSVVGAGGATAEEERRQVLSLASHSPNFTGVMMDDFFRRPDAGGESSVLSCVELRSLQQQLGNLGLWVVLYDHQLDLPVSDHLALCDTVSFWTWRAADLEGLESNLDRVDRLAPRARKVLGCYMWDYGDRKAMPVDLMRRQCEAGLQWLHEGRIAGVVFLASCICDLRLEAVEWTREWIRAHAGDPVPAL